MYSYEIIPYLQKILNKLSKKDKQLYERILNKIEEIINCENVEHYKNLRYDMNDRKSVHIGHFVLVFKFIKEESKIKFVDFAARIDLIDKRPKTKQSASATLLLPEPFGPRIVLTP